MNARSTLSTAALATLFILSAPALGAADQSKHDARESLTHLARYVPDQLDDQRHSALGGDAARAPEKNPRVDSSTTKFQRFVRWVVVRRF